MFTLYGGIILDSVYIIPAALLHCYDVTCRHEFFNISEMDKEVQDKAVADLFEKVFKSVNGELIQKSGSFLTTQTMQD